ncbi:hypothetical protein DXG03_004457 [Asterophora parasitica]|uniref:Uncharacterized protein n=1 Tax=Asterophora parasitica TaxID=117018 RepID=A0A9P7K725_9AGAR|nr:hypothetical protein DXG03_004457 [Asterophora parasitica]
MRGDYLFYEEKVETTQEERDAKAARSKIHSSRLDRFSHFSDESDNHEDQNQPSKMPTYDYSANSGSPTASPTSSYMLASPPTLQHHSLPTSLPSATRRGDPPVLLPPITTLGSGHRPSLPHPYVDKGRAAGYTPLSSEDRKVLDSFRVVL